MRTTMVTKCTPVYIYILADKADVIGGVMEQQLRSVSGFNTTSYTITNLNLGTVYEVRVASVGPFGLSRYCCGSGKQVTTYNSE